MILDNAFVVNNKFYIESFNSALDFRWDEYYSFSGEQHDFWEIVYVLSGEVECTEDDSVYSLKNGDMLIHAPMEFHKIRSAGNTNPHLYILSFSAKGQLPEELKNGIFRLRNENRKLYEAVFSQAYRLKDGKESNENVGHLCSLQLSSFLIRLSLEQEGDIHISKQPGAVEYRKVVNAMQSGLYDNLTLEDIASKCHLSVSYIKVLFARYAGVSPKSYYIKMRYDEAVLLLKSGASINEVSEKMNFSSPNYFSVFIKKQSGLPPAKLMKSK
ncbi:MAG: helix-turn-helix transcriptional regulator [Clostridia bacterium]|nr:helix-turn-helix transcriptional regulator [Clostridia bacterium]